MMERCMTFISHLLPGFHPEGAGIREILRLAGRRVCEFINETVE